MKRKELLLHLLCLGHGSMSSSKRIVTYSLQGFFRAFFYSVKLAGLESRILHEIKKMRLRKAI
jgi:hypothetical protein